MIPPHEYSKCPSDRYCRKNNKEQRNFDGTKAWRWSEIKVLLAQGWDDSENLLQEWQDLLVHPIARTPKSLTGPQRGHWDVGSPTVGPLVLILLLWGFSVSTMGVEVAGGCRGHGAEFKAERLELIPSLGTISCVFASPKAGLTKVVKHCQVGHQLLLFFNFFFVKMKKAQLPLMESCHHCWIQWGLTGIRSTTTGPHDRTFPGKTQEPECSCGSDVHFPITLYIPQTRTSRTVEHWDTPDTEGSALMDGRLV